MNSAFFFVFLLFFLKKRERLKIGRVGGVVGVPWDPAGVGCLMTMLHRKQQQKQQQRRLAEWPTGRGRPSPGACRDTGRVACAAAIDGEVRGADADTVAARRRAAVRHDHAVPSVAFPEAVTQAVAMPTPAPLQYAPLLSGRNITVRTCCKAPEPAEPAEPARHPTCLPASSACLPARPATCLVCAAAAGTIKTTTTIAKTRHDAQWGTEVGAVAQRRLTRLETKFRAADDGPSDSRAARQTDRPAGGQSRASTIVTCIRITWERK